MTLESIAAYSGALWSIVAILAVIADHGWAKKAISRRYARQEYIDCVSTPILELMYEIVEFRSDVSEWAMDLSETSARDIQKTGGRLNRKVNFQLNEAAKSAHGGGNQWIQLSTDSFETAMMNISDECRNLGGRTLKIELKVLQASLSDLKSSNTPKL